MTAQNLNNSYKQRVSANKTKPHKTEVWFRRLLWPGNGLCLFYSPMPSIWHVDIDLSNQASELLFHKTNNTSYNLLKPSVIIRLHFECSVPYRPNLSFLISNIWALWCSALSAIVPECRKLRMVG